AGRERDRPLQGDRRPAEDVRALENLRYSPAGRHVRRCDRGSLMFLAIFVFLLGAGAVLGGYAALTYVPGMLKRDKLERRLKDVSAPLGDDVDELGLVKRHTQGLLPGVDRLVANMRAGSWLAALIEQAGVRTTPSSIMGMSIIAGAAVGLVAAMFTPLWYLRIAAGALGSALPIAYLSFRR